MWSDRFYSLSYELKNKWNIFMVVLGAALMVDLYYGSPFMIRVASMQVELIGGDPDRVHFITMFGEFNNIESVGRVFDKALAVIAFILPVAGITKGLLKAVFWKESE